MVHIIIFAATKITPIKTPGRIPARKSFGIETFVDAPYSTKDKLGGMIGPTMPPKHTMVAA